jgi:hypothetical protein
MPRSEIVKPSVNLRFGDQQFETQYSKQIEDQRLGCITSPFIIINSESKYRGGYDFDIDIIGSTEVMRFTSPDEYIINLPKSGTGYLLWLQKNRMMKTYHFKNAEKLSKLPDLHMSLANTQAWVWTSGEEYTPRKFEVVSLHQVFIPVGITRIPVNDMSLPVKFWLEHESLTLGGISRNKVIEV